MNYSKNIDIELLGNCYHNVKCINSIKSFHYLYLPYKHMLSCAMKYPIKGTKYTSYYDTSNKSH